MIIEYVYVILHLLLLVILTHSDCIHFSSSLLPL